MKLTPEIETKLQAITATLPENQRHFLRSLLVCGDSMTAAKSTGTDLSEYRSWQSDSAFVAAFDSIQDLKKKRLYDLTTATVAAAFRTVQEMSRTDRAELRRLVAMHEDDDRNIVDLIHTMIKR